MMHVGLLYKIDFSLAQLLLETMVRSSLILLLHVIEKFTSNDVKIPINFNCKKVTRDHLAKAFYVSLPNA